MLSHSCHINLLTTKHKFFHSHIRILMRPCIEPCRKFEKAIFYTVCQLCRAYNHYFQCTNYDRLLQKNIQISWEWIHFSVIYSPNKYSNGQILICLMATKLTMVPKWKWNLSNKGKFIKIGVLFQKLSLGGKIASANTRKKSLKN